MARRLLYCALPGLRHQLSKILRNLAEGTWECPGIPMVKSIDNIDNNTRIFSVEIYPRIRTTQAVQ